MSYLRTWVHSLRETNMLRLNAKHIEVLKPTTSSQCQRWSNEMEGAPHINKKKQRKIKGLRLCFKMDMVCRLILKKEGEKRRIWHSCASDVSVSACAQSRTHTNHYWQVSSGCLQDRRRLLGISPWYCVNSAPRQENQSGIGCMPRLRMYFLYRALRFSISSQYPTAKGNTSLASGHIMGCTDHRFIKWIKIQRGSVVQCKDSKK